VSPNTITIAADMAWLIEPPSESFGRDRLRQWCVDDGQPIIGVNLVNETGLFNKHPRFVPEVARALDQISIEMNARILFLANEVRGDTCFDSAAASQVANQMKNKNAVFVAPAQYLSPQQMMSIITCCDLTVSMRYHFCLFSALQGVPFVAIERSDKVADLCWDMNWSASIVPSMLESHELIEHLRGLRQNAPALRNRLQQCVQRMRKRAHQNVEALNTLGLRGEFAGRRSVLAC
jgi:polysaccharide pyruvyl transferase WcaK-like protein